MSERLPSVTDVVRRAVELLSKADERLARKNVYVAQASNAQLEAESRDDATVEQLVEELKEREQQVLDYLNDVLAKCDDNMALIENYHAQIDARIVGFGASERRQRYREQAAANARHSRIRLKNEPSDVAYQLIEIGMQVEGLAAQDPPRKGTDDYFVRAFTLVEQARDFKAQVRGHLEHYYDVWYDAEMEEAQKHQDVRRKAIENAAHDVEKEYRAWVDAWQREWNGLAGRPIPDAHAIGWKTRNLEGRVALDKGVRTTYEDLGCEDALRALNNTRVALNDSMVFYQDLAGEGESLRAYESQIWLSLGQVWRYDHQVCLCSANGAMDHSPALARYVKDLPSITGGRVLTGRDDIGKALREHVALMDDALQGKLVGYASVDEFNHKNKAKPLPWRLLCVSHFPGCFDERMTSDLISLMEQGPRAGIRVLVQTSKVEASPYGGAQSLVQRVQSSPKAFRPHWEQGTLRCWESVLDKNVWLLLPSASSSYAEKLIACTASALKERANASLGLLDLLPADQMQRRSSANRIALPFGINEEGSVQSLQLGDVVAQGSSSFALVVGPTGSGKSVFLHNLVTSALYLYPPSELQLCLLDFKEGTEFAPYAEARLPHLRYVALDSMQQFAEGVLAQLCGMMRKRAEAFKAASAGGAHVANIAQYRAAGHHMPRILVVMDEFQELFDCDRDRRCANRAAALFGELVSKGRAFGIHFVLATQTIHRVYEGNYSISRATLEELHVRVGLKCSEREFANLMGTDKASVCVRKASSGEHVAVFMDDYAYGTPQGVRVAYLDAKERVSLLDRIGQLYAGKQFKAAHVFRGTQEALVPLKVVAQMSGMKRRIYLGEPIAIGKNVGFEVASGQPANLLVVGEDRPMLARIADTVMGQIIGNAHMDGQVYLFDGDAMRVGGEGPGVLGRLAQRGVRPPGSAVHDAANAFQVLPVLREAYDLYQRRRTALASGQPMEHANEPVYLVILNYQQIDPLVSLMEGKSVADYEVAPTGGPAAVSDDPFQALLDDLSNDLAMGPAGASSEPSVPARQMLRTLLESGHLCGFHTIMTCGSVTVLGRLMRSDLAPFNHRLVLPMASGVHAYVDTDIDLKAVRGNCALYSDGQHETCLIKPFALVYEGGAAR